MRRRYRRRPSNVVRFRRRRAKRVVGPKWRKWAVPALAIALVAAWYLTKPLVAPQEWVTVGTQFGTCGERGRPFACVTDGDTVTLGYGRNTRRIRLTGFDAPEIEGACRDERLQAERAQAELQRWLNAGPFEWDGGTDPPFDKFGRELREVRRKASGGGYELLGEHMIEAKLASGDGPWEWRDWCD